MAFVKSRWGDVGEKLGEGVFGTVYAQSSTLAIKVIRYDQSENHDRALKQAMNEIHILERLQKGKYVVQMQDNDHLIEEKRVMVLMERYEMNLAQYLETFQLDDLATKRKKMLQVAQTILFGLSVCHANGVIHRDFHPGNVFIRNGDAYIGDFGLSIMPTKRGSLLYDGKGFVFNKFTAPEIIKGMLGEECYYDAKVDVWSAACVIAEMVFLTRIVEGSDDQVLEYHEGGLFPSRLPIKSYLEASLHQMHTAFDGNNEKIATMKNELGLKFFSIWSAMLEMNPSKRLSSMQSALRLIVID